jgi:hypothetical protein
VPIDGTIELTESSVATIEAAGPKLSNVSLRGTLDARELGALVVRSGA